jgi:hypothetical protein
MRGLLMNSFVVMHRTCRLPEQLWEQADPTTRQWILMEIRHALGVLCDQTGEPWRLNSFVPTADNGDVVWKVSCEVA